MKIRAAKISTISIKILIATILFGYSRIRDKPFIVANGNSSSIYKSLESYCLPKISIIRCLRLVGSNFIFNSLLFVKEKVILLLGMAMR